MLIYLNWDFIPEHRRTTCNDKQRFNTLVHSIAHALLRRSFGWKVVRRFGRTKRSAPRRNIHLSKFGCQSKSLAYHDKEIIGGIAILYASRIFTFYILFSVNYEEFHQMTL